MWLQSLPSAPFSPTPVTGYSNAEPRASPRHCTGDAGASEVELTGVTPGMILMAAGTGFPSLSQALGITHIPRALFKTRTEYDVSLMLDT